MTTTTEPAQKSRRDRASALLDQVRAHYCNPKDVFPGVIFVTEVEAPHAARRADAIALGLTRSQLFVDGIEIKVDRQDWLAELSDRTKADAWYRHTSRWWVAVPDPRIVHPGELPPGWGLMCPSTRRNSRRMKIVAEPEVRDPILDYPAVAQWLKKIDSARGQEVQRGIEEATRRIRAEEHARAEKNRARQPVMSWRDQELRDLGQRLVDRTGMETVDLLGRLKNPDIGPLVRAAIECSPAIGGVTADRFLRDRLSRALHDHQAKAAVLDDALHVLDRLPAGGER
ncbi:hypothetical protein MOQ72_43720 [Saccharopolyspora sp. K220]|uniref:hypothetical protein n=1 Tax=Saccharopolyspora soli TaxID=2926618 RepID=UPI001F57FF65|nr:hypothetical protein [Saccharopolyspora soli]MCI2424321.1 hypothetical protein [Saccharopolyspora soli]